MIYRIFAGGTLIAAPLIVLAVQNFAPAKPPAPPQAGTEAAVSPPPVQPIGPSAAPSAPPQDFAAPPAGEPMAEAGRPSIDLGNQPPESDAIMPPSGEAPPGSPNAEP